MFRVLTKAAATAAVLTLAVPPVAWAGYAEGVAAYGAGRHDLAAREFLAAAQAGDTESAYMLGRLYAMGSGVPQDWGQAWTWHDRAARQGHELAAAARESLETIMTPAQLAGIRATTAGALQRPSSVQTPSVQAYDTGAYEVVPPAAATATPTAQASLFANGATFEGMLSATGGMAEQIRLVQRRLNREGYWAGPVDGRAGPLTRQAIRQYQRDHGIAADGRITGDLVTRLGAAPPQVIVHLDRVPDQAE